MAFTSALQGDDRLRSTAVVGGVWGPGGRDGLKALENGDLGFVSCKMTGVILNSIPIEAHKDYLPSERDKPVWDELGPVMKSFASDGFTQGAWPMTAEMICIFMSPKPVVDLASIKTPVKLFHGKEDMQVPARHSEVMASGLPNAELTLYDGEAGGHMSPFFYKATEMFGSILYDA